MVLSKVLSGSIGCLTSGIDDEHNEKRKHLCLWWIGYWEFDIRIWLIEVEERTMSVRVETIADLETFVGNQLGTTSWRELPFDQIVDFANATGDQQWIHVDAERIEKESPFGAPIAHGYLTLSLVAGLFFEVLDLSGMAMVINYGCNKVRFPNPLKANQRFRLVLALASLRPVGDWCEAIMHATIEIEGEKKPACFAEVVYRLLPRSEAGDTST